MKVGSAIRMRTNKNRKYEQKENSSGERESGGEDRMLRSEIVVVK